MSAAQLIALLQSFPSSAPVLLVDNGGSGESCAVEASMVALSPDGAVEVAFDLKDFDYD